MSYLVCGDRKAADQYSSSKSLGQFTLAASLIVDDIKDLYDAIQQGEDAVKYYWGLVVIIAISLFFQVISMIFALILYFNKYPKHTPSQPETNEGFEMEDKTTNDPGTGESTASSTNDPEVRYEGTSSDHLVDPIPPIALKRLNDGLTVLTVLLAVLHIMKTGLQSEVAGSINGTGSQGTTTPSPP